MALTEGQHSDARPEPGAGFWVVAVVVLPCAGLLALAVSVAGAVQTSDRYPGMLGVLADWVLLVLLVQRLLVPRGATRPWAHAIVGAGTAVGVLGTVVLLLLAALGAALGGSVA